METYLLKADIKVYGLRAKTFPEGIKDVYDKLHVIAPLSENRTYYGISHPENGKVKYCACTTEVKSGEFRNEPMEELLIPKGEYIYIEIVDFMKNIPSIEKAFNKLTQDRRIEPKGMCVEWYLNNRTVRCMIKIKSEKLRHKLTKYGNERQSKNHY